MSFGFLTEFWDSIAEVVISGGTYTVDWFKSLGNAVAGAVGNIFIIPLKAIVEFGLAIAYIFKIIILIAKNFFGYFEYLGVFFSKIADFISVEPTQNNLFTQSQAITNGLANIPFWGTMQTVIIGCIFLGGILATIKSAKL